MWSTLIGTFGYCILSGFVPVFHAEAYLLVVSAFLPAEQRLPLAFAATCGQMVAKAGMYGIGHGLLTVPGERARRWIAQAEAWVKSRPQAEGLVVFVSAFVGLPPFYVTSVACGLVHYSLTTFLALGFAGRLLRFTLVVLIPEIAAAYR